MMVERFASASDDIMVFIAIARDWLTFVATAYGVQTWHLTSRDRNFAARHDSVVSCYHQVAMVIFTIITMVIRKSMQKCFASFVLPPPEHGPQACSQNSSPTISKDVEPSTVAI